MIVNYWVFICNGNTPVEPSQAIKIHAIKLW